MVSYFRNYSTRNDCAFSNVIILSTILNTAYFIPFVYKAFQKPQKNELSNVEKLPKSMIISIAFVHYFLYIYFLTLNYLKYY